MLTMWFDTRLAGGSNQFLWNARLQGRRIRVARRRSWDLRPTQFDQAIGPDVLNTFSQHTGPRGQSWCLG
jgi:hypothetical protein